MIYQPNIGLCIFSLFAEEMLILKKGSRRFSRAFYLDLNQLIETLRFVQAAVGGRSGNMKVKYFVE